MSSWDVNYIFGDYSSPSASYVSESKNEVCFERGAEEVSSTVRCDDAFQIPDLNQRYVDEPESYQWFPAGTYDSHAEVKRANEWEEGATHFGENDNEDGGDHEKPFKTNQWYQHGTYDSHAEVKRENECEEGATHFGEGDNEDGSDHEEPFKTNQEFGSIKEMEAWVFKREIARNFVTIIARSNSKVDYFGNERKVKVWFCCDRGGKYICTATKRRSGSKKTGGCPFSLKGTLNSRSGGWRLEVVQNEHNHEFSQHLEGHAFARRLTPKEEQMVESLYSQNLEPSNILLTIRKQNPQSVCILRDISNVVNKFKKKLYAGRTPMQVLEKHLKEQKYIFFTQKNHSTNAMEEILFIHQHSLTLWRAFPHVLMIDTTYQTNEYKLPFVQIIGVTSTHKSFCVAHAFISKEKHDNFLWLLERLRDMLVECMEPRVIVTDRDLALMNACDKVFPNASKLLCRWHISQNILKHWKKRFTNNDWKIFKLSWRRLCESNTLESYEYNYNRLYIRLHSEGRKEVMDYLSNVWLDNYKERFVSFWTNSNHNFGQHTTNRVESQHANLKRYLKGHNSSLHRLVQQVDKILESQVIAIKHSFQNSLSVPMGDHKIPMFDNLRGKVSHKALDLLLVELEKLDTLRSVLGTCGHQLFTSCGLPCVCRLSRYQRRGEKIPLGDIDVFWTRLNIFPETIPKDGSYIHSEIEKKFREAEFAFMMNPSMTDDRPLEVQKDTRGRPTAKAQQQRNEEADEDGTKRKDVQRNRTKKTKDKQEICDAHFPLLVGTRYKNLIETYKDWLPTRYRAFITDIEDVQPDGNCGFRVIARGLGMEQNQWLFIRQQLLDEMIINESLWRPLFHKVYAVLYDEVFNSLIIEDTTIDAPWDKWMTLPFAGLLAAQKFGMVIQSFSNGSNHTYFPMFDGPATFPDHTTMSIGFVKKNHFISLTLTNDCPMPPPDGIWSLYATPEAREWETLFADRITQGKMLISSNRSQTRDYVNID